MSAVCERFQMHCSDLICKTVSIGGIGIRLNFADGELYDKVKTSLDFPGGKAEWELYIYRRKFDKTPSEAKNGYGFRKSERGVFCSFGGCAEMGVDYVTREGFICFNSGMPIPFEYQCHPLRALLHYIMLQSGKLLLHSAAVGLGETGIMISSSGGHGKSTLAIAALLYGMQYLGDDYIIFSQDAHRAEMLYTSGYLNRDSIEMMPELKQCACASDPSRNHKTLLNLSAYKNRYSSGFLIRAIVFPVISDRGKIEIVPVPPHIPTAHLAVSTAAQISDPDKNRFITTVMAAVKGIPAYQISLTRDLTANCTVLSNFVKKLKEEQSDELHTEQGGDVFRPGR